nr:alkaline phosphatase family protein [Candidatus Njordarchaeum guaymaensis]
MRKGTAVAVVSIGVLLLSSYFAGYYWISVSNAMPQETGIKRVIVMTIDSCNPEYISPELTPNLYGAIRHDGVMYPYGETNLAAETQNGHTSLLCGAYPNSTGIVGNGLLFPNGTFYPVVIDPKYRLTETIFEILNKSRPYPGFKTAFISGKWRLPPILAQGADLVLSCAKSGFPIPQYYRDKLGDPVTSNDGDIVDPWVFNALLNVVEHDDPQFIFVNFAWTDTYQHRVGDAANLEARRHLAELDNQFEILFSQMKRMGKYSSTLFVVLSDHGMNQIRGVISLDKLLRDQEISYNSTHIEGGSAFLYFNDNASRQVAISYFKSLPEIALVVPSENMSQLHLDTERWRRGDLYVSTVKGYTFIAPGAPISYFGDHGGVGATRIVFAFIGAGILNPGRILSGVPSIADVVPTIGNMTGWPIPSTAVGSVLDEVFS